MSKRAGLHPKVNSKTKTKRSAVAMMQPVTLFSSLVLLAGEDDAAYHELLSRVRTAINPVDIIDEMFIADVVSLEWEVLRWRRLKSGLMQMRGLRALENFLREHLDYNHCWKFFEEDLTDILKENLPDQTEDIARKLANKCFRDDQADARINQVLTNINLNKGEILLSAKNRKAEELAREYLQRKPAAIKLSDKLLTRAGLSSVALMAGELAGELDNIERIDRLTTVAETRRNAMLCEIDRRRALLSKALRRQVQEVEGEFEVIEKSRPATKSAA